MSGKITIPTGLPENVQDWKRSEVLEFLNNNRIQYDLDNEDIQVIGNNKVAGVALLALTEEKLRSIGGLLRLSLSLSKTSGVRAINYTVEPINADGFRFDLPLQQA
ncbi:3254_t:CDS:2, partial [Paraglomus occultum]